MNEHRLKANSTGLFAATFLVVFLFYLGLIRGQLISTDEILCYEATRSIWMRGTADMVIGEGTHLAPGRHGLLYSAVNSGQSFLCLPLFATGRFVEAILFRVGALETTRNLTWPPLARNGLIWGGELELLFCSIFNVVIVALTVTVFLACNLRLGVRPKWALASTVAFAFASYPMGYAGTLFTQPIEALCTLWAFYFLLSDRYFPDSKSRWAAGLVMVVMLQCRFPSFLAFPALWLYHLWNVLARAKGTRALRELLPMAISLGLGLAIHAADQYWKFDSLANQAAYAEADFDHPLWRGLVGFLLSPGDSVFLYTPLLILTPWTLWRFWKSFSRETVFLLTLTGTYLVVMGSFENWHGLWCFGPRYTVVFTPVLLLPLGHWLQTQGKGVKLTAGVLTIVGAFVNSAHVLANFWWVTLGENWLGRDPMDKFLFEPGGSMVLAQLKALWSWDHRVDFLLVRLWRMGPTLEFWILLAAWLFSLALALWWLRRQWTLVKEADEFAMTINRRFCAMLFALVILWTVAVRSGEDTLRGSDENSTLMTLGIHSAYQRGNHSEAITYFEIVLQRFPHHLGANYQRARCLETLNRQSEIRKAWEQTLNLAQLYGMRELQQEIQARLDRLAE